ncbi:MAG: hypothetical protein HQL72_03375 [Magnetococcales bacterium]|nr:hypothetical protein [Magnetococcales bacterium]
MKITQWMIDRLIKWLIMEKPFEGVPLCNFSRLRTMIKPGDVVLVEGRSRSSTIIKIATQSPWSHAALSIGPLNQIENPQTRALIQQHYHGPPHRLLIIEALMDRGVVVSDLQEMYGRHHLRICRPAGLSAEDTLQVLHFAASQLGLQYDFRHLLDLTRHLLPYPLLPRRWGSRIYADYEAAFDKTVCSSMLARAFMSVSFPIVPLLKRTDEGELILYRRNYRIMTPRDFDVSPYFDIVKYPLLSANDLTDYRNLPWDAAGMVCNREGDCFIPGLEEEPLGFNLGWKTARHGLGSVTTKLGSLMHHPFIPFPWKVTSKEKQALHPNNKSRDRGEL